MDALDQLHAAQQRVLEGIDAGSWGDVRVALDELTRLELECLYPALRTLGIRESTFAPAVLRRRRWKRLLDGSDDDAHRDALGESVHEHVGWTGAELLTVLCRHLSDDRFDVLGQRMARVVAAPMRTSSVAS